GLLLAGARARARADQDPARDLLRAAEAPRPWLRAPGTKGARDARRPGWRKCRARASSFRRGAVTDRLKCANAGEASDAKHRRCPDAGDPAGTPGHGIGCRTG